MPIEIEVHTVPHFKAPVNVKVELRGLECSGPFTIQTSLFKIGCLVQELCFVATEVVGTLHAIVSKCKNLTHLLGENEAKRAHGFVKA